MLVTDFIDPRCAGISETKGSDSVMNHVAEVPHDSHKVRIVGRMRDRQVKIDRRMRGDLPIGRRKLDALQGLLQGIKLGLGTMGRG